MTVFYSPVGNSQIEDANGNPLVGGKIYTYLAGTSTPAVTYTSNTGLIPQSNPIVLNSLGQPANPIWLLGGVPMKFIIKNSAEVQQGAAIDNITGVNDNTATIANEWINSGYVATYVSDTSFTVAGDKTLVLQVGRRLRTTNTSGVGYSTIFSSIYGVGVTTVVVVNDSVVLDAGLSKIEYGFLSVIDSSVPIMPIAPPWVSGQTYLAGTPVFSVLSKFSYRRITTGSGLIDPSIDPANWDLIPYGKDNARLVADAMLKIRLGTAAIVCQGDSLTYGYDIVSGGTVPATPPHTANHVATPYPETLQAELNRIYCTAGTVVTNRGYAGHTALTSFNYWITDPSADLVFLMLGTNDAKVTGLSLADYITYMTAIIERYNAWGAGVVIVTSPSLEQGTSTTPIESYRYAVQALAKQLGCPVFRGDEVMLNNSYAEVYSDTVHFNQVGYTLLGNSIASFVAAGGLLEHPNIIANERTLLYSNESHVATNAGISIVGAGASVTQGITLTMAEDTLTKATIAFYLDADAAYVTIVGRLSTGQDVKFDSDSIRGNITREGIVATTSANYTIAANSILSEPTNDLFLGQVIGRGWHSVTVSCPLTASTTTSYLHALRITPRSQEECSTLVHNITKRSFSLYDPYYPATGTPAASSTTSFVLPKALFASLLTQTSVYPAGAFVAVEIFHIVANSPSYTKALLRMQSAGLISVSQVTSFGTNQVSVASATVVSALNGVAGDVTFTLTRPAAGYMEMRFEVPDMPQLLNVALM